MSDSIMRIVWLIIAGIASLGGVIAAIGFIIYSLKKGGQEVVSSAGQLSTFWKEQSDGFKQMLVAKEDAWQKLTAEKDAKTQATINSLSKEVGELRGQLDAKASQAKEYLEILQNRNPEMKEFMTTMLGVAQVSQTFMLDNKTFQSKQGETMQQVLEFMQHINQHLVQEAGKDIKVEATVSKV